MNENICEQCGTRNEPGAQFCVECQAFLPWYDTQEADLTGLAAADDVGPSDTRPVTTPGAGAVDPVEPGPDGTAATLDQGPEFVAAAAESAARGSAARESVARESDALESAALASSRHGAAPEESPAPLARTRRDAVGAQEAVRVAVEPLALVIVPGGEAVGVEVQIFNLSPIVDAYRVTAPQPPPWLTATSSEVRLLPNSNERTRFTLQVPAGTLVPAGVSRLLLRVQSVAHPDVIVEEQLEITVPAVAAALVLRLDPSIVRVKDNQAGRLQATIDNSEGNQPRRVTLTGRDPEGLVRFFFAPGVLDVPAGGTASAALRIEAPTPEPGQQATRQLTVLAADGRDEAEASATFVQTAAVELPMVLRAEPTLVRAKDTATGQLEITVDNRKGSRTRRVFLGGRDPEGVVHFAFSPPSIDVFAGEVGRARLKIEAPPPPAGQESSRPLTVLASSDGAADLEVAATFVQSTSAAPVDTPVILRLDPSVVRVRDTRVGQLEAIVDNRGGSRVRRVFLSGRDPERLVRFTFSPPSLDVLPGDIGRVRVRLEAQLPDPGQEATRQVTVVGSDGRHETEASGSFVQITSAAPVETPVALKLEPSLVRVRDNPSGQFQVIIDNRQGIRHRRVTLAGADPERALGFSFWPPVVEVDRGQVARATGRVDAYPPEPGREVTRQFSVSASDGAKEVETAGTFVQSTSPPAPDEPMTVRLEPSIVRVRNSGTGVTTVYADNRGGSRPRQVRFTGHDPERVVRFAFAPPVIELAPGQVGAAQVQISAPRPEGGEEITRQFSVVASDGSRDTEATGSFAQETSDRRPMWRILLTVLGALLMIAGAFLTWNVGASLEIPADVGAQVSPDITGLEWSLPAIDVASEAVVPGVLFIDLPNQVDPLVSAGAVIIVLAALALLGLTGSTGRLTRLAALVAAVALAAFVVAVGLQEGTGRPGVGVFVIFAGCVIAFTGGLFAKPRRH
jgi:hypothetical protein